MANSIGDLIKKVLTGNDNPLPNSNIDPAAKARDLSYQGDGMAGTYNTHDECGAVPVTKAEEQQAKAQADA